MFIVLTHFFIYHSLVHFFIYHSFLHIFNHSFLFVLNIDDAQHVIKRLLSPPTVSHTSLSSIASLGSFHIDNKKARTRFWHKSNFTRRPVLVLTPPLSAISGTPCFLDRSFLLLHWSMVNPQRATQVVNVFMFYSMKTTKTDIALFYRYRITQQQHAICKETHHPWRSTSFTTSRHFSKVANDHRFREWAIYQRRFGEPYW